MEYIYILLGFIFLLYLSNTTSENFKNYYLYGGRSGGGYICTQKTGMNACPSKTSERNNFGPLKSTSDCSTVDKYFNNPQPQACDYIPSTCNKLPSTGCNN
jgi:hypothetical protein